MAFNGNGVFNRLYSFVNDALAGINILSSRMDNELNGIATGLSNAMTRDGQSPPTQNIPMGGFQLKGLATPTDAADAVRKDYVDAVSTGLEAVTKKLGNTVYVTDPPYNAVGDGVTDDSAAIQAAVDANKGGTIILPPGKKFLGAGIILSGATYSNTRIVIAGTFLLKAVAAGGNFDGASWNGIVFHNVDSCSFDVEGMLDGNRDNQPESEHTFIFRIAGATNTLVPNFRFREVSGDAFYCGRDPLGTNNIPQNVTLGPCSGYNIAVSGRNGISVTSVVGWFDQGGMITNVGGVINGIRMPGGIDFEVDDPVLDTIGNVKSGPWNIKTGGTTGIGLIGRARTSDSARDWNISDVYIAPSTVEITDPGVGGPTIKRCARVTANVTLIRSAGRNAGTAIDYADFINGSFCAVGCSLAVEIGHDDFVNDSNIDVAIEDHSAAGLVVAGANRCTFTGYVRGGQGAGSYGVQIAPAGHGAVTQTGNTYSVNVPYDAGNTFGLQTGAGATLIDCALANCSFAGYPSPQTQCGFAGDYLPSVNVIGRNMLSAIPTIGYWAASDVVLNTATAAGGTPGWVCTAQGNPGTWKAMANVAV